MTVKLKKDITRMGMEVLTFFPEPDLFRIEQDIIYQVVNIVAKDCAEKIIKEEGENIIKNIPFDKIGELIAEQIKEKYFPKEPPLET